ncbi:MAG: endonuclease [Dehalococcoidales bacterium]|nr:endonuclease [Dehalococcoidales bacterium]
MSRLASEKQTLQEIFQRLFVCFGPQHWWPAEEPFEVIVGAILTQSTTWTSVEKAISNLKKAGLLSPAALRSIPVEKLAELIHSSGYFNAKAVKLKAFAEWLGVQYQDNLQKMFERDTFVLRNELLQVHGIGEETADSILLYAGNKPIFVIDAYTRRIIERTGINPGGQKYRHYQGLFMRNLPSDAAMFNEYHALLVALGKNICRKRSPLCNRCCLQDICNYASSSQK